LYLIHCTPSISQELAGTCRGACSFSERCAGSFSFQTGRRQTWSATFDSPDQGATGMSVSEVKLTGDSLFLDISDANSTYSAKYFTDSAAYIGTMKQGDIKFRSNSSKAMQMICFINVRRN